MLTSICPGIWCVDYALKPTAGVMLETRMTVVDLGDGELLLHSPVPMNEELVAQIETLGKVCWIVAPNDHHHLFAGGAAARFPEAMLLGTAGAQKNEPEVKFSGLLSDGPPAQWSGRLEMIGLAGTRKWHEFVFYPVGKQTLICTDLVFHMHKLPNLPTHLLAHLIGVYRKFAQSRTQRWLMVKDRSAYARSLREVLAWDFDRVIMGHGRIVESGGKEALRGALNWVL